MRRCCIPFFLLSVFFVTFCNSTLGQSNDLATAKNLGQQADQLSNQGRYKEAIPIAEKALAIYEKALGPDHPDVARSLNSLALLYDSLGDYGKAEPLYQRSLAIREKALGLDHPDVAISLNNLAFLYYSLGDYAKAEPLYQRSLAIKEKALGPNHPKVATSLNNLAGLYQSLGDYAKAEPLLKRSLAIREKTLGPDHSDVATSLNNLAGLYDSLGDYGKAEPLYQRSLAIREKALGPDHPDVANSLNCLAEHYESLGDYAKAEPLYKRSLAIQEKALGPDHPDVANSLNCLAGHYESLGDYAKAEPLEKRSLTIREKALGPDHPDVATSLDCLAGLYQSLGSYAKAEPLEKRSLTIREKALGPDHPAVANSLNNLAFLYYSLGDYAKAEPLYQRSLVIREKTFGTDHPHVVLSLNNLGLLYAASNRYAEAHALQRRAQEIDGRLIDQVMGFTTEEQKLNFLSTRQGALHRFLAIVAQSLADDSSARREGLDVWLRRKGIILEAQRKFQEALVFSDDPRVAETFQALSNIRAQLSRLIFAGPGKESPETYKQKIADLEKQKELLEAQLSTLSRAFAAGQKVARADCAKVAKALPEKALLLEFARIDIYNFKAKGTEKRWFPAHYIAFVLQAGKSDNVGLIDLGDADTIDKAIVDLKKEITQVKGSSAARKLHDLVFSPLLKEIGATREIFISPDGNLNLIPFEVLRGPDGRFLIEDYTFNYLATGREILGFGQSMEKGGKALIVGDPDFDMGESDKKTVLTRLGMSAGSGNETRNRSTDLRSFTFNRLPGTRQEVQAIYGLLGPKNAELRIDREALEEVLRQKKAPMVLHLATHGFFLSDTQLPRTQGDTPDRAADQAIPLPLERGSAYENPLLRSGIALAGANVALQATDIEKSDGIVTAEKILGLRLRGTDLVVLSACQTGLGEVRAGEGVFGLRRAFTQAGAKSLVMSMWSVPDQETKELMVEFYKNVFQKKMKRSEALRQAALKQMEVVKVRYGSASPFYWGPFVFLGEP